MTDRHGVRVELVRLPPDALQALGDGDQAAAEARAPVPLSPYLAGPECRWVWSMRAEQVRTDPPSAAWITAVVWDPERRLAVGRAGFHGPPDDRGMVEVGYSIDPEHRRRGYARAAVRSLLDRAAREPGVRIVRASVGPANEPSLRLVRSLGFAVVGEQVDEQDGPEIVHERPAG
ncbi:GNAT family N-acetyltransferase [Blastococcus goldschmidtiae]|uniref:GNAT family N-acetyltransferase n=1 Tax=Blastococcus goldschmidtiae TaxID=3075546 RepID=A0ABU2K489_9ACTN|nr:GNAT family N-acetyltransferase [Blastococcus sp. DSM 46792]MDT0274990.1 GNAT family N-acetyltransferase [Blastococcus sp. DSM 46792]